MLIALLLCALSLPTAPLLRFLFTAPSRAVEFPPPVPVLLGVIPDTSFDYGGLV